MLELDIYMFGGRGANSSNYTRGNTTGDSKARRFYDRSDKFKGMYYLEYEEYISKRKTEWIGLYDENGKIVIAGTSQMHGSVAVPDNHPDFNKVKNMTHNHPIDKNRTIGGTFSEKDVMNGIHYNLDNTRAVAPEATYILNKGKSVSKDGKMKLYNSARMSYMSNRLENKGNRNLKNVQSKLYQRGKTLSEKNKDRVYYGTMARFWRENTQGTGYNYIEKKNR